MIDAKKIESNFKEHLNIIRKVITGDRQEQCINMIKNIGEEYIMAPASIKPWFHSAFPGGYVEHVNRVVEMSMKQTELYKEMGGTIDFTTEELVFSALFHDLGKMGTIGTPNYIKQTDAWRKKNLGEEYTINEKNHFMLLQDRSLFLLQEHGIKLNQKEYIAIRTHDGVFDDANKAYYISRQESSRFKTNIVYILHAADNLASKIEYDLYRNSK